MTVWMWTVAATVMAAFFVLGGWTAKRSDIKEQHWTTVLGVIYAVVGLVAVIDLAHVQHRVTDQINCNQGQNEALIAIGDSRRAVDTAALAYDERLQDFYGVPVELRQPDNQIVIRVKDALNMLVAARQAAVKVQSDNPFPDCH